MGIDLAYGTTRVTLSFADNIEVDEFSPLLSDKPIEFDDFRDEFAPVYSGPLANDPPSLVIVNDGHRSTPTAAILDWLERLDRRIITSPKFLVAAGSHEPPSTEHYQKIFGHFWETVKDRVSYHDAHNRQAMTLVGRDEFDAEVYLNKAVTDNERVLIIGSVEPHYFAGFTGGRKALFPGLTDFETIARNHNLANSLEARPMRLAGNPMAEHLESLLDLVDTSHITTIQTTSDSHGNISGVFCGSLRDTFKRAVVASGEFCLHQARGKYDAAIGEMLPPLDKNLYHAQKALENIQMGVRDGGAVVVVSACSDGIGSDFFYRLADNWDRQNNCASDGKQHFGSHKLSRVNAMSRRLKVGIYSELEPDVTRHVFYEPVDDIESFISRVGEGRGSKEHKTDAGRLRLAVVHDAGNTVLKA